YQQGNSNPPTF
nr:immunoglobulin light chain junction region [Macaca mulatta]